MNGNKAANGKSSNGTSANGISAKKEESQSRGCDSSSEDEYPEGTKWVSASLFILLRRSRGQSGPLDKIPVSGRCATHEPPNRSGRSHLRTHTLTKVDPPTSVALIWYRIIIMDKLCRHSPRVDHLRSRAGHPTDRHAGQEGGGGSYHPVSRSYYDYGYYYYC